MTVVNRAFYAFAPLNDLPGLRQRLSKALGDLNLKGTLILAPEGVNGFLAGPLESVENALSFLRGLAPGLEQLKAKDSPSRSVPFRHLRIKLKKEIVTFGRPEVSPPDSRSAPRISPAELASWYREGKDFVILDTRNAYEWRLGTFERAHTLPIDHFVQFAPAIAQLPEEWKSKPVVTFCTGGIRCEKAAPFLASQGFQNVRQLEDGILGWFAAEGGQFWQGECFVFDDRIALAPDLSPTGAALCERCQGPVPKGAGACPHCAAGDR